MLAVGRRYIGCCIWCFQYVDFLSSYHHPNGIKCLHLSANIISTNKVWLFMLLLQSFQESLLRVGHRTCLMTVDAVVIAFSPSEAWAVVVVHVLVDLGALVILGVAVLVDMVGPPLVDQVVLADMVHVVDLVVLIPVSQAILAGLDLAVQVVSAIREVQIAQVALVVLVLIAAALVIQVRVRVVQQALILLVMT